MYPVQVLQDPLYSVLKANIIFIALNRQGRVAGVPNDCFEENPPYSVPNITRVSLRQSCLIFNFPGKKYPLFTASKRDFEVNGLPAASARL